MTQLPLQSTALMLDQQDRAHVTIAIAERSDATRSNHAPHAHERGNHAHIHLRVPGRGEPKGPSWRGMAARIRSLEKSLAQAREVNTSALAASDPPFSNTDIQPSAQLLLALPSHHSREEILVQKGSSGQYFNEAIFSKVLEEVRQVISRRNYQVRV